MRATVIIPTRGRPVAVKGAIRSLLAVDPRKSGVEIVVVDNNSDESLSSDLRAACAAAGDPVRYVAEPSPGLGAARHRGAQEARGEVLIYIDDDVQISPGWLEAFLGAFEDGSVGIAGGPSVPLIAASIPAWLWAPQRADHRTHRVSTPGTPRRAPATYREWTERVGLSVRRSNSPPL